MSTIIGVHYDTGAKEITKVKLDDGTIVSKQEAINMAERGQIADVIIGGDRAGGKTLRARPDDDLSNNLLNLPKF